VWFRNPQLPHFVAQGLFGNFERSDGLGLIPIVGEQRLANELLFDLGEMLLQRFVDDKNRVA
jgi:hypothetical protein